MSDAPGRSGAPARGPEGGGPGEPGALRMPSLGADMDEGRLVEWRVRPGDRVRRGELFAVVDTPKAAVEIESWEDGVVAELCVAPGKTVPVGTVLARLAPATGAASAPAPAAPPPTPGPAAPPPAPGPAAPPPAPGPAAPQPAPGPAAPQPAPGPEASTASPAAPAAAAPATRTASPSSPAEASPEPAPAAPAPGARAAVAPSAAEPPRATATPAQRAPARPPGADAPPAPSSGAPAVAVAGAPGDARRRASPYARRRARELGVDLARVEGSGPHGTIHGADVERAAAAPTPAKAGAPVAARGPGGAAAGPEPARIAAMREAMARAMARSKREIPHYHLATDVDLGPALAWLEASNRARPIAARVLPAALLLRAIALGAAEVPEVNGLYRDGVFAPSAAVHLGVAVSLREGGLIAPALLDAQALSLEALMAALSDLVQRARRGGLRGRELSDATLTVTNLGDLGVGVVHGVIYPPQVALVGVGKIEQRPRVVAGEVVARPVVTISLAADHRVSDGHRGGRFLAAVARRLGRPEELA